MIYFNSDYLEGAHPSIMVRLAETNMVQTVGYGEDEYCEAAREKIKTACQAPEADVHFLVGGTQTAMRPVPSSPRAIRSSPCPPPTARSLRSRCRTMWSGTETMSPRSTSSSPVWCTSPTPLRAARCIPRRS